MSAGKHLPKDPERPQSRSSALPAQGAVPQGLTPPSSPFAEAARIPTQVGVRSPPRGAQSPTRGPQSPTRVHQSPSRGPQSPQRGLQSPTRGPQSPHRGLQSPQRGPQTLLASTSSLSAPMQDFPHSPARPSSSDAAKPAKNRNQVQGGIPPTAAGKEEPQTQPAMDRPTPSLKRRRLIKAGELVKKRAAEGPAAAVPASSGAQPVVRGAGVGGLALVPLPPKLQQKVQTEAELMLLDEDAPYWQEPAPSGQYGAAPSGRFESQPVLGNAARLLRASYHGPTMPGAVPNSPEHPSNAPRYMPDSDLSLVQAAAAAAVPGAQSGYGMSTSVLPALSSEPSQHLPAAGQVAQHPLSTEHTSTQQQQQQQHSWGMHEQPSAQLSESTQKGWMPPLPRPKLHTLQSQGGSTGPRDGPQDPRRHPTKSSSALHVGTHQQNAHCSSEQPPSDLGTNSQQPSHIDSRTQHHADSVQGHAPEQPHQVPGHVQEQPCHQQGSSSQQTQQLQGRSQHRSRHRSHSQTSQASSQVPSQAAADAPSQALSFGVKRPVPVSAEPVRVRTNLGYKWGDGSQVQGSIQLEALCWSTHTIGKNWNAMGRPLLHSFGNCISS